jgi:hypothetical protein
MRGDARGRVAKRLFSATVTQTRLPAFMAAHSPPLRPDRRGQFGIVGDEKGSVGGAGAQGCDGDTGAAQLFGDAFGQGQTVGFGRMINGHMRPRQKRGG